jgi:CRP-like cAMP-binding protein
MLDTLMASRALMRNLERYASIPDDARESVLALSSTIKTYLPGAYLVRSGDRTDQYGLVISGFAFRHKITTSGCRQIVGVLVPEDLIDSDSIFLASADHNVQVMTEAAVAIFSREAIRDLFRSTPSVAESLMVNLSATVAMSNEWIVNVGRRDARGRVAHLLCEVAIRLGKDGRRPNQWFDFPMTQEQIGDAVGLTPVHVNRVMRALDRDGLTERSKRRITFPNWEGLLYASDFHDGYLRLNTPDERSN